MRKPHVLCTQAFLAAQPLLDTGCERDWPDSAGPASARTCCVTPARPQHRAGCAAQAAARAYNLRRSRCQLFSAPEQDQGRGLRHAGAARSAFSLLRAAHGRPEPSQPRACAQERAEGHNLQGRDSTAQYFYRSSMSDPEYSTGDRLRTVPRGLVTPTVHVAEGALGPSCADTQYTSSSSVSSSSELRSLVKVQRLESELHDKHCWRAAKAECPGLQARRTCLQRTSPTRCDTAWRTPMHSRSTPSSTGRSREAPGLWSKPPLAWVAGVF